MLTIASGRNGAYRMPAQADGPRFGDARHRTHRRSMPRLRPGERRCSSISLEQGGTCWVGGVRGCRPSPRKVRRANAPTTTACSTVSAAATPSLTGLHATQELAADALLLGRITHEGMAQAWPTRGGNPFADHVNSITKYVVASQSVDTTARDPTVVIAGSDLLDEVSRLKLAEGGDTLIWGTGQLTDGLAAAGLLGEYRICTYPVIKGGCEPLFRPASTRTVELLDTRIFSTGAVVHAYHPAPTP